MITLQPRSTQAARPEAPSIVGASFTDGPARYELKCLLRSSEARCLSRQLEVAMELDEHCRATPRRAYTVRSIYFDSPGLVCFHDKREGQRVREKFRLRTYDEAFQTPLLLESKRKSGSLVSKTKVRLAGIEERDTLSALEGACRSSGERAEAERTLLDRFAYHRDRKAYRPTVLVTYDRQAYVHPDDDRLRITFDRNLRARLTDDLDDLYAEDGLGHPLADWVILELKFGAHLPRWLRLLAQHFRLRTQACSKYCTCLADLIDAAPYRRGRNHV